MRYFKTSEFRCDCAYSCGLKFSNMDPEFLERLELARLLSNVPYKINSSVRCEAHNADVNGSRTSSHLKGVAVDIAVETSHQRFQILYGLIKVGFKRIGIYENFIHVDEDVSKPQTVAWYD